MKLQVDLDISKEDISSMLTSALEGGSNYWYNIIKVKNPNKCEYYSDIPLNGGSIYFEHDDGSGHKQCNKPLDEELIAKGLIIMSKKFSRHFSDLIEDNADAETGDVFLQCCLFGDVPYG